MTWTAPKGSATSRGYGTPHRQARATAMAKLKRDGIGACCLCGQPIHHSMGSNLHLDHDPSGNGYRGLACARCNISDGSRRAAVRSSRNSQRGPSSTLVW